MKEFIDWLDANTVEFSELQNPKRVIILSPENLSANAIQSIITEARNLGLTTAGLTLTIN